MNTRGQNKGDVVWQQVIDNDTIRVLHVDDDESFLDLVRIQLERESDELEVITATNAEDGLSRCGCVDCVVSDLDMPGMNGLEFLERVREDYPNLPFILYTGKGSEEVASEAISAGVTDYLQKETGSAQYELLYNRVLNAVEQHRTERAFRYGRKRYRSLVEESPNAICLVQEGEIVYANEAFRHLVNASDVNELYGTEYFEFVHPEYHEQATERMERIEEEGVPVDRQTGKIITVDGEIRDVEVTATPISYNDTIGTQVVIEDITDLKKREQQLQAERNRRSALFENTPDPIIEVEFDDETPIITDVNAGFEATFGFEAADAVGQPVDEVVVPETERDEHETLKRRVLEGEAVETDVRRETATGVREFRLRIIPIDVGDVSSGAYAWYTDLTERKERERALREQKERFRKVFEQSHDAIMIVDMDDEEFLEVNAAACEMLEYDREELLDLHPEDIHPSDIERVREEFLSQVLEEGSGWTDELECLTKHGNVVPTEISGAVLDLDTDESEPRTMVAILRDISQREAYRKDLEDQVARLDSFVTVASHDLRNPLNVANGHLELAREECDNDHLDTVADALDRMETLLAELSTFAREGRTDGDVEPVALDALARESWKTVETGDATLNAETDMMVSADRSRLIQVFGNLFQNAVEHGGEGVTITVGDLDDGFYVEDTGPGIPEEERNRVFDVGYSTRVDGTGFGLTIVKNIVEDHGWTITVTEGEAGGARFEITGVEHEQ